ncbi:MAG TPA: laccase domain-containing protein, partial [Salinisphaeraceae bacterium]|nr:laccase domain-containing protein [Salinisphaeraceae bacterium]
MTEDFEFLAANWPAPGNIRAGTTLRSGGVSAPPFASLNLGEHSGDSAQAVAANRARLQTALALPSAPAWLSQVHGIAVADAASPTLIEADAGVASSADTVCAVLTADCLPVLFCDHDASCWGAAHAGWRGLAAGILEATLAHLAAPPSELLAWLGPAIGPGRFEVGAEVREAFLRRDRRAEAAFRVDAVRGTWHADLYHLA